MTPAPRATSAASIDLPAARALAEEARAKAHENVEMCRSCDHPRHPKYACPYESVRSERIHCGCSTDNVGREPQRQMLALATTIHSLCDEVERLREFCAAITAENETTNG